jgi:hypothetical protein
MNVRKVNHQGIILFSISVAPLFVIEFLHRIMDVFEDYFGECTETSLKDNYVIVYEVNYTFFKFIGIIIVYSSWMKCLILVYH